MEPEVAALASTAGTALVNLLATEGWQRARDAFAALWRRSRPERAESVAAELEATREDVLAARADDDPDAVIELGAEWRGRIRRLLAAHPELVGELRAVLAELVPEVEGSPSVTQTATASGDARVFQAGRDIHLGSR